MVWGQEMTCQPRESRLKDVVWGKAVLRGGSSKCKFLRQEALGVRGGLAAG